MTPFPAHPPTSPPVVLVTGAGRGIGAACARQLAQEGWTVFVNFVRDARAAEAVAGAIEATGGKAHLVQADIGDEAEVARIFATIDRVAGRLDGLVNNAGILGHAVPAADLNEQTLLPVFRTNVFGAISCIREAVRHMATTHGGRGGAIVNISSTAARTGGPLHHAHYAASKGALDSLTVALTRELGSQGIRINSLRPGVVSTDIHSTRGGQAVLDGLVQHIPLGRLGEPQDIAEAVSWLLSPRASFVHGSCIDVAGGR